MREIFTDTDSARVGLFQSLLEEAGIGTFLKNQYSNNMIAGGGRMSDVVLCVVNDHEYNAALEIIKEAATAGEEQAEDWICSKCGESVPGSFDRCWSCQETRKTDLR